jgi:hypothetical protein
MGLRQTLRQAVASDLATAPDPAPAAVRTWRSLRLAMVLLAAGLATSVLYERLRVPGDCWQESISAYYYTPVQGVLVGTLVAIGVCLVALRGSTDGEDVLLNLAGLCAPFVALVPDPHVSACGTVLIDPAARDLNVANNVTALLALAGLALVVAVRLVIAARRRGKDVPTRVELVGLGVSVVLFAATVTVFAAARPWFIAHGHVIAAVVMFGCVFLDVVLNARHLAAARRRTGRPARTANRYAMVAALMAATVVAHVVLWLAGWAFWALSLEAGLIVLFAVFWLLQTVELWNQGLRRNDAAQQPPGRRTAVAAGS